MGQIEAGGGHGAASLALKAALPPNVPGDEGNLLTEDEQWAKLRLVVDTARKVWG
jgi:hypothetical protein